MQIISEADFSKIDQQFVFWKRTFPEFYKDIKQLERSIEIHRKNISISYVLYRQTHKSRHLNAVQNEIKMINSLLQVAEKMELMAMLSR